MCAAVFRNDTAEPALEALFTQAFREQLLRAGTLGGEDCDSLVEGGVESVGTGPILLAEPTFTGPQAVTPSTRASYRVSATVRLRLLRNGRVLSETSVSGSEDFLPGDGTGEVLGVEVQRQAALQRLAEALMLEGYERLATAW